MASRALQGDGTLSGIGAATSLLALTALGLYRTLGWWWADQAAALTVAAIAAAEAWHRAPGAPAPLASGLSGHLARSSQPAHCLMPAPWLAYPPRPALTRGSWSGLPRSPAPRRPRAHRETTEVSALPHSGLPEGRT